MFSHRFISAVFVGILLLFLTACVGGSPTPSVTPAAPEPLQAEPTAIAQLESPLATPIASAQPESLLPALESPLAPPAAAAYTVATPSPGKASVAGRLINFNTNQPLVNQNLSLPAVLCPPGVTEENIREQCTYVIDEAFDPSALTDGEGRFVFRDIAVGEYVLMIGNRMTESIVLSNELKQPLIWKVEADKVSELGDLVVDLR